MIQEEEQETQEVQQQEIPAEDPEVGGSLLGESLPGWYTHLEFEAALLVGRKVLVEEE